MKVKALMVIRHIIIPIIYKPNVAHIQDLKNYYIFEINTLLYFRMKKGSKLVAGSSISGSQIICGKSFSLPDSNFPRSFTSSVRFCKVASKHY